MRHEIFVFGSNLAGYTYDMIAPMFRPALEFPNIKLCDEFLEMLNV